MSKTEAPKVFLTDDQWDYLKRHEDERTREINRHNAIVQKALVDALDMMAQQQSTLGNRDWFAGQALVGMGTWAPVDHGWPKRDVVQKMRAEWAYEQADAMIAAREGGAK